MNKISTKGRSNLARHQAHMSFARAMEVRSHINILKKKAEANSDIK
ncbi:MAG: hypothetical protein ACE5D6_04400 [Candidatus Zixiibacteriota bacterium]